MPFWGGRQLLLEACWNWILELIHCSYPLKGKKQTNREPSVLDRFPGCCDSAENLKDDQLKIPIDAEEQPVAQPIRHVTYHLRDKLTGKLKKLVGLCWES